MSVKIKAEIYHDAIVNLVNEVISDGKSEVRVDGVTEFNMYINATRVNNICLLDIKIYNVALEETFNTYITIEDVNDVDKIVGLVAIKILEAVNTGILKAYYKVIRTIGGNEEKRRSFPFSTETESQ